MSITLPMNTDQDALIVAALLAQLVREGVLFLAVASGQVVTVSFPGGF